MFQSHFSITFFKQNNNFLTKFCSLIFIEISMVSGIMLFFLRSLDKEKREQRNCFFLFIMLVEKFFNKIFIKILANLGLVIASISFGIGVGHTFVGRLWVGVGLGFVVNVLDLELISWLWG